MLLIFIPLLGLFIFYLVAMFTGGLLAFVNSAIFSFLLMPGTAEAKYNRAQRIKKARAKRMAKEPKGFVQVDADGYITDERFVHREKRGDVWHTEHFWSNDVPEGA